MKRLVDCLALGAALGLALSMPANADQPQPKKVVVAPADEYFGKMKMSILGIRNQIHDLTLRIGFEPAKAESFLNMATLTEDALKEWERRYPDDPWIPKSLFALGRMYSVVHWSSAFNTRAKTTMTYLHAHYATTWYGKEAAKELAGGLVGKLVPTPAPTVAVPAPPPIPDPAAPPLPASAAPLPVPQASAGATK